jgi:hypothetical protein
MWALAFEGTQLSYALLGFLRHADSAPHYEIKEHFNRSFLHARHVPRASVQQTVDVHRDKNLI